MCKMCIHLNNNTPFNGKRYLNVTVSKVLNINRVSSLSSQISFHTILYRNE